MPRIVSFQMSSQFYLRGPFKKVMSLWLLPNNSFRFDIFHCNPFNSLHQHLDSYVHGPQNPLCRRFMSHLPGSSDRQKQDIAERFFQGDLSTTSDDLTPCDHVMSLCLLPMAMFFVAPMSIMAGSIGILLVRDPKGLGLVVAGMFKESIAMGWHGPIVVIVLLLLTAAPTIWMWNQGISAFRSVGLGCRERKRERETGQYRYGLLLTKDYLAVRTLDPPYDQAPLILGRHEISQFRMKSTGGGGGARSQSIVMDLYQPDGTTRVKYFPAVSLKESQYKLHLKLRVWCRQ